ncbi:prophage tail fiber C-terminus family protein [Escherichia coli]|nr:prophage tail fiber C-terminus family protein [Escherichia coli]
MNVLKKLMQRLCGYGKHDDREHGELLTAQLRLGPADILESDENGIIPEQDRVITQVVILDADKKQIQCVVRPLQILRADGTWWICPYISRHLLSLNPLQARCRRYSRGER